MTRFICNFSFLGMGMGFFIISQASYGGLSFDYLSVALLCQKPTDQASLFCVFQMDVDKRRREEHETRMAKRAST